MWVDGACDEKGGCLLFGATSLLRMGTMTSVADPVLHDAATREATVRERSINSARSNVHGLRAYTFDSARVMAKRLRMVPTTTGKTMISTVIRKIDRLRERVKNTVQSF